MHFRADPIRAAVRKAHEAGQRSAIDRLLTAFGRTLAHQIAPELVTPITPRITKADDREHGPASDPDLESDPHQALILAQIDHLIRCRETGADPEPGDKRLHALWDEADELASVLMPHAHDPQQQKALAFAIYCKAAERAPKGGISLGGKNGSGGKFYAGGQWIPSSVIASASPDEKKELAERKDGTRANPLNARDKKKAATAAKYETRAATRKHIAEIASDLMLNPHEATPDKYRDLAAAIREADKNGHLAVNGGPDGLHGLRALRLKLSASFGGGRRKEQMVAALLAHADAAGTELLNERAREVNANRKPEPQSKSRKKDSESILQYVRDYGGIDPTSHELLTSYENMQRAYQDGIPMAAFKTGGRGLDQIARELETNGHIHVPEDEHAGSYVLDLLREKAYSLHADLSKQYAKALDEYYVASGQASRDHSTAEIESSARSGAQTGRVEGENDALGEHGESPGRGPGAGATGSGSDPLDMSDDDFFKWFTEPASEAAPAAAAESKPSPVEQEVANRAAVAPDPASAPTSEPAAPATSSPNGSQSAPSVRDVLPESRLLPRLTGHQFENMQKQLGIRRPKMGPEGVALVHDALEKRPGGKAIAAILALEAENFHDSGLPKTVGDAQRSAIEGKFTPHELLDAAKWASSADVDNWDSNRFLYGTIKTAKDKDGRTIPPHAFAHIQNAANLERAAKNGPKSLAKETLAEARAHIKKAGQAVASMEPPASASPATSSPNAPASAPSAVAVADELRTAYNRLPPRQPGDGGPPIPPRKDVADLIGRAQAVSKPLAEGVSSFLNGGQQYSSRMYHTARELVDKHERDAKVTPATAPTQSGAIDLNDPHAFSAAVHDAAKKLTDYTGQPYRPDMSHAEVHKVPLADIYDSLTSSGKLPHDTTLEAFKDAVNAARTAGTVELARNDLPQVLTPADWERTKRSETPNPLVPNATAHYLTVPSEQPKPAFVPYTREKRPDRAKPFSPNVPPSAASAASEQAPLGKESGTAAPTTEPVATAPTRAPFRSRTRFRTAADHAPTEAEFAAASQVGKPAEVAPADPDAAQWAEVNAANDDFKERQQQQPAAPLTSRSVPSAPSYSAAKRAVDAAKNKPVEAASAPLSSLTESAPASAASAKGGTLHEFDGEDGMKAVIHPSTLNGHKYAVSLRDADSGETVGTRHFKDEDKAIAHAQSLVKPIPPSTRPVAPLSDHATADHTSAISAIPRGDSRFIAGHRVRHTADGKFQVERKGGFLTGDANTIGQHINASWAKQQGYPSHGAALARASAYAEPDPFTDPGAASRDAKLRSEVPEGAKAVSLDADTHGRIGTVRRDPETGKVHLAFDGGEETKGSDFEPLDAAHSWRAPESERNAKRPKGGAAASLFSDEGDAPAAKSAESADASPIWKRERPRRERGQIGEISGLQASRTSGRQLDRLNNRADAAMGNVPDGLSGYAKEVINAHENGDVDENTPGIHPDASRAIRDHKQWKREQKQSANSADIGKWNQVSHSQLAPGMKVYTGMGETPHTVSKVNDKSVTLQRPDGSKFKVNPSELTRMSWSDRQKAQAAISAGNPIPSEIATKYPELVSKAGAVVAAPAFKPAAPATGELFNNEKDNLFSGADTGASEPTASANAAPAKEKVYSTVDNGSGGAHNPSAPPTGGGNPKEGKKVEVTPKNSPGSLTKKDEIVRNRWLMNEGEAFVSAAKFEPNGPGANDPIVKQATKDMYAGNVEGMASAADKLAEAGHHRVAAFLAASADVLSRRNGAGDWSNHEHSLPLMKTEHRKHLKGGVYSPEWGSAIEPYKLT